MNSTPKTTGALVIFVRGYPKTIRIYAFPDGYDKELLADRYRNEYTHATNVKVREAFLLWVMQYAEVDGVRLSTPKAINDALGGKLETLQEVFHTVLLHNAFHIESEGVRNG